MELSDSLKTLNEYLEEHTSREDPVLTDLRRYTYLNTIHPRMISGPVQGKFLELISTLVNPSCILEIGTFTGYSAICLAKGLKPEGRLITIDILDEHLEKAKKFFEKSGLSQKIICFRGDAVNLIPDLKEEFDIVFIDGEKEQYPEYYELSIPKLKPGGILIADNVLWDGKVLEPEKNRDTASQAIINFNSLVQNDKRVENMILPLRDGIMVVRKNQV